MGKSRFVLLSEVPVEMDLGDGDKVWLKSRLSWGDRQAIRAVAVHARIGGEGNLEADLSAMNLEFMARGITEWNLKDSEGRLMPITRENIQALDELTGDAILERLTELYRPLTEETKN